MAGWAAATRCGATSLGRRPRVETLLVPRPPLPARRGRRQLLRHQRALPGRPARPLPRRSTAGTAGTLRRRGGRAGPAAGRPGRASCFVRRGSATACRSRSPRRTSAAPARSRCGGGARCGGRRVGTGRRRRRAGGHRVVGVRGLRLGLARHPPRGHYEPGAFDVRTDPPRPTASLAVRHLPPARSPTTRYLMGLDGGSGRVDSSSRTQCQQRPRSSGAQVGNHRPTGTLGRAFARVCAARGLAFALLSPRIGHR